MRTVCPTCIAALVLMASAAPARAQAVPNPAKGTVVPRAASPVVSLGQGPLIAPAKPSIAPVFGPGNADRGAIPNSARTRARQARELSVSARQSAEKTIAALVAAMKDLPRKPDPPTSERRVAAAPRRAAAPRAKPDDPAPIDYKVTWPAASTEAAAPVVHVDLAWPDRASTGPIALRWDDPVSP